MAGNYDPLHDVALTLATVIHSVVTNTTLDVDALMRITGRLGIDHGTDPSEIEDKLRGNIERRARSVGPYGDMQTSLNRLMRGQALPALRELRGGEGAEHG